MLRDVSSPANPLNGQLRKMPDLATFAVFMNAAQAPFDNQKVREAFSMAIDREAFVQGVQQGAGVVTVGWVPPGMPGYSADAGKQWAYDPAKAKKALADAGFPEGRNLPKVTYTVTSTDSNRLVGQFLQDQLKKNLGVEIALDFVDSRTFGQRFTANQYSMATVTWIAAWPYPDNFLAELFMSEGNNNHVAYKDAKFDDLMKRAAAEPDDKKRLAYYDEAQKLLLSTAPIAPMYNRLSFVLVKPNVKDLTMTPMDGALQGTSTWGRRSSASNFCQPVRAAIKRPGREIRRAFFVVYLAAHQRCSACSLDLPERPVAARKVQLDKRSLALERPRRRMAARVYRRDRLRRRLRIRRKAATETPARRTRSEEPAIVGCGREVRKRAR